MTILVSSDWHFSANPRDQYRHNFQKQLRAFIVERGVQAVIFLGDICEAKDEHPAVLVNQVVEHFYQLSRLCPTIILKGNHDYKQADNPYFAFLDRIEGIYWEGNPDLWDTLSDFPVKALGHLGKVLFLPHTNNYERDWQGVNLKEKWNWIFAHQTFEGADIGGRRLEGVPPDIFPKSAKVISGDIHVPQTFGQISYVGAPYTVDFGDDYEPRFYLIETGTIHTGKLHSIKCEGPQKRLVEVNSPSELPKQKHINPGDILKIRIKLGPGDYARWAEIQDRARAWGEENGYVVHLIQAVSETPGRMSNKQRVSVAPKSDRELFQTYCKARGIDDRTIKVGEEFIK